VHEGERASLIDHLEELRARIIRSGVYVILGAVAVWFLFNPLYGYLLKPIREQLAKHGGELQLLHLMSGFMLRMQVAMVGGVILAAPLIYYEIWGFVAPGLTREERAVIRPIVPASGVLFFLGVALAYLITAPSVAWLMRFNPQGAVMRLDLNANLAFIFRFYLAFGLAFELPLVVVLLAALGIVDARLLTSHWREAIVIIFIVAAIITPTWDWLWMTVCAIPMVFLYLGTIGVVKLIDVRRARRRRAQQTLAG
jgi:sec-independent protein translocase protein TatC